MKTPKYLFSCLLLLLCAATLSAQHIKPDIGVGDVIPELVWKDRTIKKNVKIINSVAGRVILGIDGETEAVRIEDFQKIVQLTNTSLDTIRQEVAAKEKQEEEARKRAEALVASQNGTNPATSPSPTAPSLPTPTPPAPLAVPTVPTTPPTSPFGSPLPTPAPATPATPVAPAPENPFTNTVPPTTSPTPAPTTPVTPEPIPTPPILTPVPAPSPEPVTPEPATPVIPVPTSVSPPPPFPPRPSPNVEEPYEVKLLRKSIHARMIRLQEDYLTSLEELRTDYENKGEASTAQQIEQAISRAKQQQLKLETLISQKVKKGPRKPRDLRGQERPTITQNIQTEPTTPTITVAPTIPAGGIASPLDLTPEPEPSPPTPPTPPATPAPPADSTGKPLQTANGQIPVVLASIEAGDQPGMLTKYIQRWGPLKQEVVEGSPYWTVEIDYMADSIFGIFPSRAKALIQQNKVVRWITLPR